MPSKLCDRCGTEMTLVHGVQGKTEESWVCVRRGCHNYCTVYSPGCEAWYHTLAPTSFPAHAAISGALSVLQKQQGLTGPTLCPQASDNR